jgi:hypothetical protein
MRQRSTNSHTQERKILWTLQAAWPNWVPAPQLSKISLQYGRAIHALRRNGWEITNRIRIVDGVRHGEFRLGPAPIASNRELRARKQQPGAPTPDNQPQTLFGDVRRYRDPEEGR